MGLVKVLRLEPHIVDGKLLQHSVVAQFGNESPLRIGYVGPNEGEYFAPLCYFPMEHAYEVQRQIEAIKKGEKIESA